MCVRGRGSVIYYIIIEREKKRKKNWVAEKKRGWITSTEYRYSGKEKNCK